MPYPTNLPTATDPPNPRTSATHFDGDYYDRIEAQMGALGLEVVSGRNRGFACCYPKADPDGDDLPASIAVAITGSAAPDGEPLMVPATSANIGAGAVLLGVLTEATPAGQRGRVATGGALSPSVSGLAPGSNKYVRANATTAALERVASLTGGDVAIGLASPTGAVSVVPSLELVVPFDPTTPGPIGGSVAGAGTFTSVRIAPGAGQRPGFGYSQIDCSAGGNIYPTDAQLAADFLDLVGTLPGSTTLFLTASGNWRCTVVNNTSGVVNVNANFNLSPLGNGTLPSSADVVVSGGGLASWVLSSSY